MPYFTLFVLCLQEPPPPPKEKKPIIIVVQPRSKRKPDASDLLVADPSSFRQELHLLHKRLNECYQKAQIASREKNFAVASYFSTLVSLGI